MTTTLPARPGLDAVAATIALSRIYGSGETAVEALVDVTVDFPTGSFTAIMGPSGSGKSTLMHCLAGLDRPTTGQVFLGGLEITRLNDRDLTNVRRDQVGFVFQAFNLLPTLTARQNILLPLDLAGRRPAAGLFDGLVASLRLGDRLGHLPSELSGGQQQRVAIARALVTSPAVVFADEPTGALDSRAGHDLLAYLRRTTVDLGQTIVMVTHDPNAAAYADRVLLLSDGRIVDELTNPSAELIGASMAKLGS